MGIFVADGVVKCRLNVIFFGHRSDTEGEMGKLTVRAIEAAKAKDKPYKLMDGDGLQVRIATDGVKTFLVRFMLRAAEHRNRLLRPLEASGAKEPSTRCQRIGEGFGSRLLAQMRTAD